MLGFRARIGVILPHVNLTFEPEFYSIAPTGVSLHAARAIIPKFDLSGIGAMESSAEEGAKQLSELDLSAAVYGCTAGSFYQDQAAEDLLVQKLGSVAGCPMVSAADAVSSALKALGVEKVSIGTPYTQEFNSLLEKYLASQGIHSSALVGLNLEGRKSHFPLTTKAVAPMSLLSAQEVYNLGKACYVPGSDAVLLSCTNMSTLDVIKDLEDDLGVPVVSSNSAAMWSALRMAGVQAPIPMLGQIGLQ